ncbi:MAG: hypothetical protein R2776_09205 [Flavobacteriaceae bacterium]|nr:hypothetical protein [Flavobacteriaceae bacterium]
MKKRSLLIAFLVIVAGAYTGYKYLYKSHRNIEAETPSVNVEATQLVAMFTAGETQNILNKTIIVSGTITEMDVQSVILDDVVHCVFETFPKNLKQQDKVSIKGRCIGFDDLFEQAKLDQCSLTK